MGLYVGNSEKLRVMINGISYVVRILTNIPQSALLSKDRYVLKSSDGLYLIGKGGSV